MKQTNNSFFIKAPAKLNLSLNIYGKINNGLHSISSYIVFLDLKDELEIVPSKNNSVVISGPFAKSVSKTKNLILDALKVCKEKKLINQNYKIILEKNIPVGAGLGGGSADAAAIFRFAVKSKDFDRKKLLISASKLGSDIPSCLYSKPLYASGTGDKIDLIKNNKNINIPGFILVKPSFSVITKYAFSKLTPRNFSDRNINLVNHPNLLNPNGCLKAMSLGNNFNEDSFVFFKAIKKIQKKINNLNGCIASSMSGSGPTCFGLFYSEKDAKKAYESAIQTSLFENCWIWSGGLYKNFVKTL